MNQILASVRGSAFPLRGAPVVRGVLIVDDNPDKTLALQSVVEELGCEVVVASSAEAGLRELLKRNFDLALLDVQMPGMDGFELAGLIRSRPAHANLPIVFMSAIDQTDERLENAFALGAFDFIALPARRPLIKAKLSALLGLHHQARTMETVAGESVRRLQATKERFGRLLAKAEDIAIFFIDAAGVVVEWSHGAELQTGWSSAEIVGRSYGVLFVPGDVADHVPTEKMALAATGHQDASERWLMRKDGSRFRGRFSLVALEDTAAGGYGVVLRDVTESHRIQDLEEMVSQLEAFSYSVSHDIRGPLRTLRGLADMVVTEYGEALKGRGLEYMRRICAAAERLDKMVGDILAFSRVSRAELSLAPVELGAVLKSLIEDTPAFRMPNAEVVVHGPLPVVLADDSSLRQVFSNLLSNAAKFVPPSRRPCVRIRADIRGTEVTVWVEDNGIGIRAEDQTRIFEVFERANHATAFPGSGIGLSIVKRMVERMGGSVGVVSELGAGSRFWIKLPAAD